MHAIMHTHVIPPIWHTNRGEDKKQAQLVLNMYFNKLMCMVTKTHLEIRTDTMHQYVAGPTTLKTMMCMLLGVRIALEQTPQQLIVNPRVS